MYLAQYYNKFELIANSYIVKFGSQSLRLQVKNLDIPEYQIYIYIYIYISGRYKEKLSALIWPLTAIYSEEMRKNAKLSLLSNKRRYLV